MERHVTLLGAVHVAYGATLLLMGVGAFLVLAGTGVLSRDPEAVPIMLSIAVLAGGFLFVVAVPGIVAGLGLLGRRSWSRILALIVGCVNLVNIPFGTAVGAYTIWVLMQDEAVRLLASGRGNGVPSAG